MDKTLYATYHLRQDSMRRQLIFAGPTLDGRCSSLELPSTTDVLHKNYLRRQMIFDGAADEVILSYVH